MKRCALWIFYPDRSEMRKPITEQDIVYIRGKLLYVGEGNQRKRFLMKGIAFPVPPPSQTQNYYASNEDINDKLNDESYLSGWVSVLEQLASNSDVNVVRLYEMDCRFNYSSFLTRAAELGIYVMIPLTTFMGPGVLDRTHAAPVCYPQKLFDYGVACLDRFWDYPAIIAGVVGNEVMNNLKAWGAAPCVKAYLDDLARYGYNVLRLRNGSKRQAFPLLYATQHDSPAAEQLPDEAIKLTFDYLSCKSKTETGNANTKFLENTVLFGINIESWCSSLQSFEYEENGVDESSYHSLWRTLFQGTKIETTMDAVSGVITTQEIPTISPKPLKVPVIFSEMGCSKYLFNRDNGLQRPSLARDWNQISIVLARPMSEELSGFVAYGYDGGGNAAFRMMGNDNAKWDGVEPLPPSEDYINFCQELSILSEDDNDTVYLNDASLVPTDYIHCEEITSKLELLWDVELYPIEKMPSYLVDKRPTHTITLVDEAADILLLQKIIQQVTYLDSFFAITIGIAAIAVAFKRRMNVHEKQSLVSDDTSPDYGSYPGTDN